MNTLVTLLHANLCPSVLTAPISRSTNWGSEREDANEQRVTYQFISQKMSPFPIGQMASAANECSLSGIQGAMTLNPTGSAPPRFGVMLPCYNKNGPISIYCLQVDIGDQLNGWSIWEWNIYPPWLGIRTDAMPQTKHQTRGWYWMFLDNFICWWIEYQGPPTETRQQGFFGMFLLGRLFDWTCAVLHVFVWLYLYYPTFLSDKIFNQSINQSMLYPWQAY